MISAGAGVAGREKWHSWRVVRRAAGIEVERGVGGGRDLGRRRVLRRGVEEQRARPVVCALVGASELLQREPLPDPPAKLGEDDIDLGVKSRVAGGVVTGCLDSATTLFPLLPDELEVHVAR